MELLAVSLSPWEERGGGGVGVWEWLWTTGALLTLKWRQLGPVNVAIYSEWFHHPAALESSLCNSQRCSLSKACFLCEYLLWSPPLNGRFVRSGFPPAHNAASRQCKYTFLVGSGQQWLARAPLQGKILEFHLFIVASGKLICRLNLFLKIKGGSLLSNSICWLWIN